uniref:Uncharacterized protein n=1 Tax=Parascaris univalens TaxID=6257 RepID=A0A915CGG0_PARUN
MENERTMAAWSHANPMARIRSFWNTTSHTSTASFSFFVISVGRSRSVPSFHTTSCSDVSASTVIVKCPFRTRSVSKSLQTLNFALADFTFNYTMATNMLIVPSSPTLSTSTSR